jgi:hypothetical protein
MRKMISCAVLALSITALAAFGADNSIGTWKANIEKSKYTPGPMPLKSYTAVREAVPGGVKVTTTGERADGSPIHTTYTAKFDGSDSPVTGSGAPYDTFAVKQVNANTFTAVGKNSKTKYHADFRLVVSADGKSMTSTAKGTDADGKPMTLTLVLEKQ